MPKFYYDKSSVFKFILLLNSTKLKILDNLALYIIKSFELRNTLLNERVSCLAVKNAKKGEFLDVMLPLSLPCVIISHLCIYVMTMSCIC